MPKGALVCNRRLRHSDFGIPSDFVIRHSDLGGGGRGRSVPLTGRWNPISERLSVVHEQSRGLEHSDFHQVRFVLCDGTSAAQRLEQSYAVPRRPPGGE